MEGGDACHNILIVHRANDGEASSVYTQCWRMKEQRKKNSAKQKSVGLFHALDLCLEPLVLVIRYRHEHLGID